MNVIPFPGRGADADLKIVYDAVAHRVVVSLRGKVRPLPGQFATAEEGFWAAESFCRLYGAQDRKPLVTRAALRRRA